MKAATAAGEAISNTVSHCLNRPSSIEDVPLSHCIQVIFRPATSSRKAQGNRRKDWLIPNRSVDVTFRRFALSTDYFCARYVSE